MGACALLALAAVSCGKCGDSCSNTTTDSLSQAYGTYVGSVLGIDYQRQPNAEADKQKFMEGLQLAFSNKPDEATAMGMQVGLQMLNEINKLKEEGVEINPSTALMNFKKAFTQDSLNSINMHESMLQFQHLLAQAREEASAAAEEARNNAPEAQANVAAGEEAVAKLKAENPNAKTTESGLTYGIEAEGEGEHPTATDAVKVNYTGRHLNGEVFDSTDCGTPVTLNLQGVVPGFREGIMLLGKTGRATLYIPGKLAYGINGQPAAGIGPNEMLVFDVELLSIEK